MKTNQKYLFLALAAVIVALGASQGAPSFAQTVTPVTCSVSASSVSTNQAAIITASGGNGIYAWSGSNLNITNGGGSQFAVSYPSAGTYPIVVTSGGQAATCNVVVTTATTTAGALMCSPAVQTVTLGQTASVSATGGTGTYVWSSPDLTITNPNGSGFSASYASTGLKTLTVASGGVTASCAVNVLPGTGNPPPVVVPPVTPGLPETGGGYGN